jgi:hypothetical protein
MCGDEWLPVPVGIDARQWLTRAGCRNVLVVVHTVTSCHTMLDVVGCVESDPRVQVVFTVAPDAFGNGAGELVRGLGGIVLPWYQARRERFDLALAAAYGGLHELHAPLMVLSHGAGYGKRVPAGGPEAPVYGLDAQRLTRNGRVLPAAVVLSHDDQLAVLRRQCPPAVPVAVVAGDACYDRLLASLHLRDRYRAAYRVGRGQELVVVSSTWGPRGLFGHHRDLLPELMTQLPADRYRVGALLHPAVWSAHGHRQVRAWLDDCRQAGLILNEPEADWRALLIAADHVIGDHGSVTAYAAAIGRPVRYVSAEQPSATSDGSPQALVRDRAVRLDPDRPLLDQLRHANPAGGVDRKAVVRLLTSRPGRADRVLRRTMYRLMRLPEPGRHRRARPVSVPATASARLTSGATR